MLKNYCLFFLISSSFLLPLAISLIKHLSSVQVLAALYQTKHLPVSKLLLCAPLNALRGTTKISLMLPFTCMVLLLVNATQPSIPQKKKSQNYSYHMSQQSTSGYRPRRTESSISKRYLYIHLLSSS